MSNNCLYSVAMATHQVWFIVVVDDGAPDQHGQNGRHCKGEVLWPRQPSWHPSYVLAPPPPVATALGLFAQGSLVCRSAHPLRGKGVSARTQRTALPLNAVTKQYYTKQHTTCTISQYSETADACSTRERGCSDHPSSLTKGFFSDTDVYHEPLNPSPKAEEQR